MIILENLLEWVFPRKCILCRTILDRNQSDLCHRCRREAPGYSGRSGSIPFVSQVMAVWYYEGQVRDSLLRYKFYNQRSYAESYGRMLAMRIAADQKDMPDMITWVPVSAKRKRQRGFDQVELIARTVGRELECPPVCCLIKHRNTKPNSSLETKEARKANVLGAFQLNPGVSVAGKRILLLDDIITTGATTSECARVLMTGGAKQVCAAAVAAVRKA